MKILVLLLCITLARANIAGRMDTFQDVGFSIPKNVFQINENIYFRSYFEFNGTQVDKLYVDKFSVILWNGYMIHLYDNKTYFGPAEELELAIYDQFYAFDITIILSINPSIFKIRQNDSKYVNFNTVVNLLTNGIDEKYLLVSVVRIKNEPGNVSLGYTGCPWWTLLLIILVCTMLVSHVP